MPWAAYCAQRPKSSAWGWRYRGATVRVASRILQGGSVDALSRAGRRAGGLFDSCHTFPSAREGLCNVMTASQGGPDTGDRGKKPSAPAWCARAGSAARRRCRQALTCIEPLRDSLHQMSEIQRARPRRPSGRAPDSRQLRLAIINTAMAAILAGLSSSYTTALGHVAAVLAIKIGVLNLITVRSRKRPGELEPSDHPCRSITHNIHVHVSARQA